MTFHFAFIITAIMTLLAAVHVYWGHGGNWPGLSRQDLIDKVFGEGNRFPSKIACYAVAFILFVAGSFPLLTLGIISFSPHIEFLHWLNYLIGFGFLVRGFGGYLPFLEKKWTEIFVRYNRRIYNPLCIGLGFSYVYIASF